MLISVYEGEHDKIKHNKLLGMFELSGIPPAPARVPVIQVTFEIDSNGIMQVNATDRGTYVEITPFLILWRTTYADPSSILQRQLQVYYCQDQQRSSQAGRSYAHGGG